MIHSGVNSNELGRTGTGLPPDVKQSPLVKKAALRDVQNNNRSLTHNHLQRSPLQGGKCTMHESKVSGIKRLTPESPLSPPLNLSLGTNGVNEKLVQRQIGLETGKGKNQDGVDKTADCLQLRLSPCHKQQELTQQQTQMRESNLYCAPIIGPRQIASPVTFPYAGASVPVSLGKSGSKITATESNCLKVNSESYQSINSVVTDDQEREDRYLHLHKFLKLCDESRPRDYIEMLLNFSPAELSRHAIELEKRAIQLTVEEGRQMQRMKALNILGKSAPGNNPLLANQQPQSKK